MIVSLYRKYIPASVRDVIYTKCLKEILPVVRDTRLQLKSKYILWFRNSPTQTEFNRAYAFVGKYGISSFPFEFTLKYRNATIDCFYDDNKFPYVIHNTYKLYFPIAWKPKKVIETYRQLLIERDIQSAHRYVESYDELNDRVLLDIGSAEGIFALDVIDRIEHAYLFECTEQWIEALQLTFAPWKDKISIIRKYVGDHTDAYNITIDDFLKDKNHSTLFIKMDIEGAETKALKGAMQTFSSSIDIACSICVYHRKDDPSSIQHFLQQLNYQTTFTEGYMLIQYEFRKGVIRAKR